MKRTFEKIVSIVLALAIMSTLVPAMIVSAAFAYDGVDEVVVTPSFENVVSQAEPSAEPILSKGENVDSEESTLFSASSNQQPVTTDTFNGDGHVYEVYDIGMSWSDAKQYCENLGGYLACITSSDEQDFLTDLIRNVNKSFFWLGGSDADVEGTWTWLSGEPWGYSNWGGNNPNNDYSGTEDYLGMTNVSRSWANRFQWNDWTNEGSADSLSDFGFVCEFENGTRGNSNSTSSDAPIIESVTLSYNGTDYNIITQPVTIDKDSDITTFLHTKVNDNGCKDVKIYITQGVGDEIEIDDAGEYIQPGQLFSAGKTIYILAVDTDTGKSTSKATKLKVSSMTSGSLNPSAGVDGLNFKLGKDIGFTIPDSVPVLGGTEIQWSFDFIPISVEYDEEDNNKLNVVFGTNITEKKSDKDRTYFKDFDFAKYKKDLKKAASKQGRSLKQLRNDYRMTNDTKGSLFGGNLLAGIDGSGKSNVDVAGYAELHYTDNGWQFAEGQLCVNFEFSYTWDGQIFIWVVPLYYEFGGEAGFGFEGDMIDVDPINFSPEFEAYILGKVGAKIGGGVGIAKVATAGADGKATLNLKKSLFDSYFKADVDGSAKFSVKIFGKTVAEKEFAKGNFLIYETGNANGLIKDTNAVSLSSASAELFGSIDINTVYENESRTYAAFSTEWYADVPTVRLMTAEYSHSDLKRLSGNVYTESAPLLCEVDGQIIMVMQWDSSERADIDRSMLVYSLYDQAAGTWSYPVAVDDDGTADFYPCFKDGYLVWQNEKTTLSDGMTLAEIAALGEICVSKWTGDGFSPAVALTDNGSLDTLPKVAVNGTGVSVVWVTNSGNDILGLSGTNAIISRHLDKELNPTEMPVTLVSGVNAVTNLAAGNLEENICIAYVVDGDNDLSTVNDWEIWTVKDGVQARLTNNDELDSNPVFAGGKLYYYSAGNIISTDLNGTQDTVFDEPRQGLTDSFVVNANGQGNIAVWWAKSLESGTELFVSLYRGASWSDEIQVTSMDAKVRYPNGLLNADGSMLVAFSSATVVDNTISTTDLYTIALAPSYDLELLDATFDEDTMTAYATVKNSGELEISSYSIDIIDDGTVNNTLTMNAPLKAGESVEIVLPYEVPLDMSARTIELQVVTEVGEEYNTENNSISFTIGHADVAVESVNAINNGMTVAADISNVGYSNAQNISVQLRQDSVEGTIVDEQSINLSPGERQTLVFSLDKMLVRGENSEAQFYITASMEDDEISVGNNEDYVFIAVQPDYSIDILGFERIDGETMINSYAGNSTDSNLSCIIYTAVYSSAGRFKGCGSSSVMINAEDDIGVDIAVPCSVDSGDTIKTFLLDASMRPLTSCADYVNR